MLRILSHRLAVVLVIIVGLSLAAASADAAAACNSACVDALRDCKRSCDGSRGPARGECRTACAERTTCTAPGARIRTLAYVVTECTTDPLGRSSLRQKLLIQRGNCDPVPIMEAGPSTPVPNSFGLCRDFGVLRSGYDLALGGGPAPRVGVFQAIMAVLPDGSGVVFDVTRQFSERPALTPEPPEEGIFFVRADGTGLRRFPGPPSRVPSVIGQFRWATSP